jgi:chitinase
LAIAGRRRSIPRLLSAVYLAILGSLSVLTLVYGADLSAQEKLSMQKVIVAYLFPQDRVLLKDEIAADKLTRINYAFANIKGGRIVNGFKNDDQNLATLVALKQRNPSLTVLVSVGGWSWSDGFSHMALTKATRDVFVASVAGYIERHQLDGLDVDWEYPGQAGSSNHFRPQDNRNFTLLLKELRQRFDQLQSKLHRPLYLTIAAGASSSYLEHTEMDQVQRYLDTVNFMAYDYYEPGEPTGNHAPLFTDPDDPKKVSADRSVREFERAGVPAEKIVLGVPFYGHLWGDVADVRHGLFQAGKSLPPGYATYEVISTTMLNKGFERYWDETSSVPYLYNPKQRAFVSYEDAESLTIKSQYVLDRHLAGIMFWDYAGDPSGVLLNAIQAGLSGGDAVKAP